MYHSFELFKSCKTFVFLSSHFSLLHTVLPPLCREMRQLDLRGVWSSGSSPSCFSSLMGSLSVFYISDLAPKPWSSILPITIHCEGIFFLTSLLEYNCFTMVCQFLLYNKVNQLYAYVYPHIPSLLHLPPTLPIPPLQVVTKHRADLPVLCGCFPLASYFTFGSVYMSMPLSIVREFDIV